jgi:hypothetical protein
MQSIRLFLSPQVDVPDDVLKAAGQRLTHYFNQICMAQATRTVLNATYKIAPHAGEVGNGDLLVYVTQSSVILNLLDRAIEPGVQHALPGHPGGATTKLPDGRIVSEVYWSGTLQHLRNSNTDSRAVALSNLIFHEWAHNKHSFDPLALSKGEDDPRVPGQFVHFYCGYGVLQSSNPLGAMANPNFVNSDNIKAMARVLDAQNKQCVDGLYSDVLGF